VSRQMSTSVPVTFATNEQVSMALLRALATVTDDILAFRTNRGMDARPLIGTAIIPTDTTRLMRRAALACSPKPKP